MENHDLGVGVDWGAQFEFLEPYVHASMTFTKLAANVLVIYAALKDEEDLLYYNFYYIRLRCNPLPNITKKEFTSSFSSPQPTDFQKTGQTLSAKRKKCELEAKIRACKRQSAIISPPAPRCTGRMKSSRNLLTVALI